VSEEIIVTVSCIVCQGRS